MKTRITIFLFLLLSSSVFSAPPKSYAQHNKGYFFDVGGSFGGTFPKDNPQSIFEVYTTHGYQFSNTFSLGVGVSTYNTESIIAYLQLRFNLRKLTETRTSYPYIALKGGYSWSTWTGETWGDDRGPIVDLRLGWSFYTKEANVRWSVYMEPSLYQFHFIPKIGLAFEF